VTAMAKLDDHLEINLNISSALPVTVNIGAVQFAMRYRVTTGVAKYASHSVGSGFDIADTSVSTVMTNSSIVLRLVIPRHSDRRSNAL